MTAFGWDDYLRLATRLASEEDEAAHRTAISRAYYFVFHLARRRAVDNRCVESKASHTQIWACYENSSDTACKKLGIDGRRLHEKRKNADYDLPFKGRLGDEVQDALHKASEFTNRLLVLDPTQPSRSR